MARFLVSVPFALRVVVDAASGDEIDDDAVSQALLERFGRYHTMDVLDGGDYEVLGEES